MGLDFATLTTIHTILSFVAIAAGVVAVAGLFGGAQSPWWTTLFLITALATSATGFLFPFNGVRISHIVGGVALGVGALALAARYGYRFTGAWRWIYAASMVASLYFLVLVLIAQAFMKIGFLNALAPTQAEAPFTIVQVISLIAFIAIGYAAAKAFAPRAEAGA